jgi:hypothetical protein
MPFPRRGAPAIFCLGLLLAIAPRAGAGDPLEDILDLVTAGRDRVTEARSRATEARDRATEARDRAIELREGVEDRLALLTNEMNTAIDEAAEDLQRLIIESREGRADFVADGGCSLAVCEPFRQDLVTLFDRIERLVNGLYDIAGVEGLNVELQPVIDLIEALPGRALFPLYRALAQDNNVLSGGLLDRLDEVVEDIAMLREALGQEQFRVAAGDEPDYGNDNDNTHLGKELDRCMWWDEHRLGLKRAYVSVASVGLAVKLTGKILNAVGETKIGAMCGMAALEVQLTSSPLLRLGKILGKASDVMFWSSNIVSNKSQYCTLAFVQDDVRDAADAARHALLNRQRDLRIEQEAILERQQEILDLLRGGE